MSFLALMQISKSTKSFSHLVLVVDFPMLKSPNNSPKHIASLIPSLSTNALFIELSITIKAKHSSKTFQVLTLVNSPTRTETSSLPTNHLQIKTSHVQSATNLLLKTSKSLFSLHNVPLPLTRWFSFPDQMEVSPMVASIRKPSRYHFFTILMI